MSATASLKRDPPSPPASHDGDFYQSGLHHLLSGHQETYPNRMDQASAYTQPRTATQLSLNQYNHHDYKFSLNNYDTNGAYQSVNYPAIPMPQPTFVRTTQLDGRSSPDTGLRTRSGRPLPSQPPGSLTPESGEQKLKRPPTKKKASKSGKSAANAGPIITGPLSELTKGMSHIPVKDIDAWVNRSAEDRRKEVAKKKGKIARPMNSFMLYRSAYAERTKEWCAQNNHQVVSRASGQSWPLEPKEVREKYEKLAAIERDNHQKAHPGYKFAPNKAQPPLKKKRSFDVDGEPSDLDDDLDWGTPSRDSRGKRSRADDWEGSGYGSQRSTPFDLNSGNGSYTPSSINRSSWQASNPGRPLPNPIGSVGADTLYYYQPQVQQHSLGRSPQEYNYTVSESSQSYANTPLIGLPGVSHHELLNSTNETVVLPPTADQLDPQLLGLDYRQQTAGFLGDPFENPTDHWVGQYASQTNSGTDSQFDYSHMTNGHYGHPGLHTLTDSIEAWPASREEVFAREPVSEFDNHYYEHV